MKLYTGPSRHPGEVVLLAGREDWEQLVPLARSYAVGRRGGDDVWQRVRLALAGTDAPMVRVTLSRPQAEQVMQAARGRT